MCTTREIEKHISYPNIRVSCLYGVRLSRPNLYKKKIIIIFEKNCEITDCNGTYKTITLNYVNLKLVNTTKYRISIEDYNSLSNQDRKDYYAVIESRCNICNDSLDDRLISFIRNTVNPSINDSIDIGNKFDSISAETKEERIHNLRVALNLSKERLKREIK